MRAWTFTSRGLPASILHLNSDLPTPSAQSIGPHEVLVKVSHVALNVGLLLMLRLMPHVTSTPWIPELEFTGTVVSIGSKVSELKLGDEVFGAQNFPTYFKHGGTLAEYLIMPAELVLHKPVNASMAEASGLAGVGCTAIQAAEAASLKPGDKVFVNGGSGGLGSMMVQVARAVVGDSGQVIATCSGPNVEMVKALGADEVCYDSKHILDCL
jgi:reticulon-4-interacting protein 1, mitochondrial